MEKTLDSKVVVVTGAAQGIGRAIARQAAAAGARVVVADIAKSKSTDADSGWLADSVVREIVAEGGTAVSSSEDISDSAAAARIIEQAVDTYGRIDCVVNNAGILRDRMFFNMEEAEWDAIIKVHLYGYYNVSRAAAPHFKAQNSGSYIHFSSSSALIGNLGQANYAAAKMGVVGLSTGIALDMQRFNVRSNVIAPWAWSQLIESVPIRTPEQGERMRKLKESMKAEHIAPLCVFLASDLAASVSGQVFGSRGNEVYLFSQPRIIRSVHKSDGWDAESLAATMLPSFQDDFIALKSHRDVVSWDVI
ncbi:SDR family oxidoreductase [Pusillimonas noertemannii]|uniref:NAD(P)-dependent dehydrogenase (Short-subunit alcohol dehydrogenase family) n=1 Tax=Pusillimonas noertemannii TaxID=305977 RepID=A0A2U1CL21_9BURK|nr:SDR family oxidoreductase [Pusillimonas noertemannii]NYT69219.1 SDR family oxidoreductase [Pusillimonas noertemannii]PVY61688.1 NAD(P)-dependent dehydrogenase (short-subunit alcohol dehydrogenase family) [Pusillimonas noertemannii]TFL09628.1 SDR family oxidoreductase [Pusillimonas noertemannii]